MASVTRSASATAGDHSQASDSTYSALADGADWINLGNLATSNDMRASGPGTAATNVKTKRLDLKNWGFSIPGGATIDGVVASIECRALTDSRFSYEVQIRLVKGGSPTGSNKATYSLSSAFDSVKTHGGASDLWGATLDAADVNSADFGLAVQYRTPAAYSDRVLLDHVQLTVYYTESSGTTGSSSGTLELSGSSAGALSVAGASAASLDLVGSASGAVAISGASSASIELAGSAAGYVEILGQCSGVLTLLGVSAGTVGEDAPGATYHLFDEVTPEIASGNTDGATYTLGVKWKSDRDGEVTAIRFYRTVDTSQTSYEVGLWTSGGTLLVSKSETGISGLGWQEVVLDSPIAITADVVYVAGVFTNGYYPFTPLFFAASDFVSGPLVGIQSTTPSSVGNGNGVFSIYSSALDFPADSFNSTNYFVDVAFQAASGAPVDAIVLQADGSLLYKLAAASGDRKLCLDDGGALVAKAALGPGDRRVRLSAGAWTAG